LPAVSDSWNKANWSRTTEMIVLLKEHFKCIKTGNSDRQNERQWEQSKLVFDGFHSFLVEKDLKQATVIRRYKDMVFFVMDYLFVHDDAESILDVTDFTIRQYLGDWYIRNFPHPTANKIKLCLRAFNDFFSFLNHEGFITRKEFIAIKEACKDTKWFQLRLKNHHATGGKYLEVVERRLTEPV